MKRIEEVDLCVATREPVKGVGRVVPRMKVDMEAVKVWTHAPSRDLGVSRSSSFVLA